MYKIANRITHRLSQQTRLSNFPNRSLSFSQSLLNVPLSSINHPSHKPSEQILSTHFKCRFHTLQNSFHAINISINSARSITVPPTPPLDPSEAHSLYNTQITEMNQAREELFGFDETEKAAWGAGVGGGGGGVRGEGM